jgi:hypothetical protein
MIAGRLPFPGDTDAAILYSVLNSEAEPPTALRSDVPLELDRLMRKALSKDRDQRYQHIEDLLVDLSALLKGKETAPAPKPEPRNWKTLAAALALGLALVAAGSWLWLRSSRTRWAREVAIPEIVRLTEKEQWTSALLLAQKAAQYIPEDAQLQQWSKTWSAPATIQTDPPGASIYFKDYMHPDSDWVLWGTSPLENVRVPINLLRIRITKDGYEPVEGTRLPRRPQYKLHKAGDTPSGMVFVPGGAYQFRNSPEVTLEDYWIDRFEVTNKEFQKFVDQGGYQKREYWKEPFLKDGRITPFEEAMIEFRDSTGRPGPATWELGRYLAGKDDFPVNGVSWYEAAAYAAFAGKSLPTVYHWHNAAGYPSTNSDILRLSNYQGAGPARVGSFTGVSPYGAYDMAGNVAEWSWNARGATRYVHGGAWSDPNYVFGGNSDAQSPFSRRPTSSFRCAKYVGPVSEALTAPVDLWYSRDYSKEKPADDATFRAFQSFYRYDHTDLKSAVEKVDDSSEFWREETVTFNAAYGGERVIAHLFLPKNAKPPYQTVIWFPGQSALGLSAILPSEFRWFDFVIRGGRALLYPVYKGIYQRRIEASYQTPSVRRDLTVQWSKDLGRSIDYLETRPDIDKTRLAYYALSRGATDGPIYAALEPRIKTMVLLAGGFTLGRPMPEVDPINFAPRAKIPVLMLNGRLDFNYPLELSQKYLFRYLGAPEKDKRHVLFEGGHAPVQIQPVIKETLAWLDHYLGPVETAR